MNNNLRINYIQTLKKIYLPPDAAGHKESLFDAWDFHGTFESTLS